MKSESLLLTLLYAVTATAFIGTLNARGITRLVISFALAIFCLGAAIFQTNTYLAHKEDISDGLPSPGAVVQLPPTFPVSPESNKLSTVVRKPVSRPIQVQISSELHELADSARQLAQSLATINPSSAMQISDEAYAKMRENVQVYGICIQRLRTRLAGIPARTSAGREQNVGVLDSSLEYLSGAAHDLNGFFNAETSIEEKTRMADFRRSLQAAEAALNKLELRVAVQ